MDETIRWVKLSRADICEKLKKRGIKVSRNIVRKLLRKNKFVKRKMQRKRRAGDSVDRDEQFKILSAKKEKFLKSADPVISVDTKKKESLGNLHRAGSVYCTKAPESYDHDYSYLATGKAVPHGIYDFKQNNAHINIGGSHETAEFICDSLKKWWEQKGKKAYPEAKKILMLCDAGGANSYRHGIFKVELQKLCNKIAMPITVAHYPSYASKWNPIEHRVFPHVTRAMEGMAFNSLEEVKQRVVRVKTKTGLKVSAGIIRKTYEKGKNASKDFLENIKIKFDKKLAKYNYTIFPMLN